MDHAQNPYAPPEPLVADVAEPDPLSLGPALPMTPEPPPGAIVFQGVMTVEEARQAERIDITPLQTFASYCVLGMIALGAGVVLFAAASESFREGNAAPLVFCVGFVASVCVLCALAVWQQRRSLRRRHAERFGVFQEVRGFLSEEYLFSRTDWAASTLHWCAFRGYRRRGAVVALYWRSVPGHIVLARSQFASEDDWRRALDVMQARLAEQFQIARSPT
jgi:hypothetical protein